MVVEKRRDLRIPRLQRQPPLADAGRLVEPGHDVGLEQRVETPSGSIAQLAQDAELLLEDAREPGEGLIFEVVDILLHVFLLPRVGVADVPSIRVLVEDTDGRLGLAEITLQLELRA
eukprot:966465-Rhodomonas_salina.1